MSAIDNLPYNYSKYVCIYPSSMGHGYHTNYLPYTLASIYIIRGDTDICMAYLPANIDCILMIAGTGKLLCAGCCIIPPLIYKYRGLNHNSTSTRVPPLLKCDNDERLHKRCIGINYQIPETDDYIVMPYYQHMVIL
jgi:hypothetical protein